MNNQDDRENWLGEKKDDWGTPSPSSASSLWATGVNSVPRGARKTSEKHPRSSYNVPDGLSQPAVDNWGVFANPTASPLVIFGSRATSNSLTDDWESDAYALSSVKVALTKLAFEDWGAVAKSQ